MGLLDFIKQQITEKGWLSLSNLYFDNSLTMNVFNTRGYIAYSQVNGLFFTMNCLDSTDSAQVEHRYVLMDNYTYNGMQQNLTVAGEEHLQHFDMAQYSHYRYYNDGQKSMPYPKIPTPAEILAMVPDETTGLYPNTDTVTKMDHMQESAIGMYPKDFEYYSGAWIRNWQAFYNNHEKFKKYLSEYVGVTDAI